MTEEVFRASIYYHRRVIDNARRQVTRNKKWHRPINVKTVHQIISLLSIPRATFLIDSDCCRLTHGQRSFQQQSGQVTLQSVSSTKAQAASAHVACRKNMENHCNTVPVTEVHDGGRGSAKALCIPEKRPSNLARSPILVGPGMKKTYHGFPIGNIPVRAFYSRARRGFSTPLTRRRSSCPPPSPNPVLTHPIERTAAPYQASGDSDPCLALACHYSYIPSRIFS